MAKKLIIPSFKSGSEEVAWREKDRAAVEADMRSAMRNGKALSWQDVLAAAEQHQFEIAEKAIAKLGRAAGAVLRHLRVCGKYASGFSSPPPPPGLNGNQMREMLAKLVEERLVRFDITNHVNDDRTYELVPGTVPILDELLFR